MEAHEVVCVNPDCGDKFYTTSTKHHNQLCPACTLVNRILNRSVPKARAILNSLRIMDLSVLDERELRACEMLCDLEKYPFQKGAVESMALDLGMDKEELNGLLHRIYQRFGVRGRMSRYNFIDVYKKLKAEEKEENQ
jgi:hypothetical protein